MKVTVLVENELCSTAKAGLQKVHGLSLYIETGERKMLFDVGPGTLFAENAERLGIDISEVDSVILSHGHRDHGGGLEHFLKINKRATVYMHREAGIQHYAKLFGLVPLYIGLDQKVIESNRERIELIDNEFELTPEISLLETISATFPRPESNKSLFKRGEKGLVPDDFRHELVLVIKESDGVIIFTGCSHSGIVNMLERAKNITEKERVKAVLGGFHLHNPVNKKDASPAYLQRVGESLKSVETNFYTGHCTGPKNFSALKSILGERLHTMNTGRVIEI